ncbi:TetR/AcrR family transcriptional regulator [Allobaculum mucilyticum]|uniref:TetR/AcrR family transcriptional regulator n=1 Tax=Allobaculum mucilyticum TaxID=2834459 RepID=UPI001E3D2D67|nr:TetR/AcrR family transcriptional regulator [Allobaculum mucilyticum]UNT96764.1 TetR/AcrR family transcriptional regulator [Allobaculum mucilyticum]
MSKITKNALSASLKKLLLQKPFDKITVTDITEDCGLNRMTFYYHFQDIYDLLEWTCQEDARKYLKNKKTYDTWQEGYLNIFYGALENKEFILNVYHSVRREYIEQYLDRVVSDLLLGVVEERAANMTVREKDKLFIAKFYQFSFVGTMLKWIDTGMKEKPEYIVERTATLIHGSITRALEASRTDRCPSNKAC